VRVDVQIDDKFHPLQCSAAALDVPHA
jgi:hypothetical protein